MRSLLRVLSGVIALVGGLALLLSVAAGGDGTPAQEAAFDIVELSSYFGTLILLAALWPLGRLLWSTTRASRVFVVCFAAVLVGAPLVLLFTLVNGSTSLWLSYKDVSPEFQRLAAVLGMVLIAALSLFALGARALARQARSSRRGAEYRRSARPRWREPVRASRSVRARRTHAKRAS